MAVAMFMRWPGVTAEQYDEARERVNWESDVPDGAKFHVATFGPDGARITDVWESQEAFERFGTERLMPVTQEIGIDTEPEVEFAPVHALFAPMYEGART